MNQLEQQILEAKLTEAPLLAKIERLEAELADAKTRHQKQVDYSIALQRAVEHHCRGVEIPSEIATKCPHHSKMLNDKLSRYAIEHPTICYECGKVVVK